MKLLRELCLIRCGINSEIAIKLSDALLNHNDIKIQLCKNLIDDKAVGSLAKLIVHLNLIKVDDNRISDNGNFLLNLLQNKIQCDEIDFSNNPHVIKAFKSFWHVFDLLDQIHANTDFSQKLLQQFMNNIIEVKRLLLLNSTEQQHQQLVLTTNASHTLQCFCNISKLNLSGTIIDEQATDNLVKAFDKNLISLQCVSMNNCGLNSKTTSKFVLRLQNMELTELQFCHNNIGDEAAEILITAILKWGSLKVFKVKNNNFSEVHERVFKLIQ